MEVEDKSKHLLTINMLKGLFCYNRLVFGESLAPALWQRAMDQVLHGLSGCFYMLEDMIITGSREQQHLADLRAVLFQLKKRGLKLNKKVQVFFSSDVEFWVHAINEKRLHKSPSKVEVILNCSRPENVTQLRSFLGLVNYYKIIPHMSSLISSLHRFLKSNVKFEWCDGCEKAF